MNTIAKAKGLLMEPGKTWDSIAAEPMTLGSVFTGYVLPGSMAESLAEGKARRVRINGTELDVRARITRLHGLSGHADSPQMIEWLSGSGHSPSVVVLNHGDNAAREGLAGRVQSVVSSTVAMPQCNGQLELS